MDKTITKNENGRKQDIQNFIFALDQFIIEPVLLAFVLLLIFSRLQIIPQKPHFN